MEATEGSFKDQLKQKTNKKQVEESKNDTNLSTAQDSTHDLNYDSILITALWALCNLLSTQGIAVNTTRSTDGKVIKELLHFIQTVKAGEAQAKGQRIINEATYLLHVLISET